LSHVFARLEKAITETQPNQSLLVAWRAVLQPNDNDDIKLVSNIGTISTAILKLESQIKASVAMQPPHKQAAQSAIGQIKTLLAFSNLTVAAMALQGSCTAVQHGMLGMIGLALQPEFSEPRLQPVDAEEIKKALLEVKDLLVDTSIALDLRHELTMQIDQMLIWLNDIDVASSSELYEKVGAATFTAALIKDGDKSAEPESAAKSIWNKVGAIATKMISFMSTATRFVDGATQLESSVHHLLGGPPIA
jgi:hypothetical protein